MTKHEWLFFGISSVLLLTSVGVSVVITYLYFGTPL